MKHKHKRRLLRQIIKDFEALTIASNALGSGAKSDADAGRLNEAIYKLVEAEPKLHQALAVINMASYTNRLNPAEDA